MSRPKTKKIKDQKTERDNQINKLQKNEKTTSINDDT